MRRGLLQGRLFSFAKIYDFFTTFAEKKGELYGRVEKSVEVKKESGALKFQCLKAPEPLVLVFHDGLEPPTYWMV